MPFIHIPGHLRASAVAVSLAAILPAAGFCGQARAEAVESLRQYDIPAGSLAEALNRYAQQSGVALVVDADKIQGLRTEGLRGGYGVEEGFNTLLRGSGYVVGRTAAGYVLLPAPEGANDGLLLPAVEVTAEGRGMATTETAYGPVKGYAARRSATATKTDTPLLETPQSVTVVTRDQIVETGATTLDQALSYAAGVRGAIWGVSTRLDGPQVRGGEPIIYLDGLNDLVQYWTSTPRVEPYLLERVEVLRGPSSMLFGQGTTAGVINNVSKPPLDETQREIGVQIGSFDRHQIQTDLTGPLTEDGEWLYRLVAVGRESGTQMDYGQDDRRLIAPSLTWRPNDATEWTLRLKWQQDRGGGDSGNALPWEGTILPNPNGRIPRDTFVGEPDADFFNVDSLQFGWSFTRQLDERWKFRQNLRVTDNDVDYAAIDAFAPYLDADQRIADRVGYAWKTQARILAADQHLEGALKTGAVEHRLLAGFDALRYHESGEEAGDVGIADGGTLAPIDIYAPVYDPAYVIPPYADIATNGITQLGLYLQDQMRLDSWILVAGLRHDRAKNWERGAADRKENANTKRLGAMYEFAGGLVPYVSYSESFQPQANTASGQRLKPLRGEQWEAGVKYEPPGAGWRANAAVYDLKEKNRTVEISPTEVSQRGRTENTGVELEWVGQVADAVEINANYTYTNVDEELTGMPERRAAIWGAWRFAVGGLSGFSLGLGTQYASEFTDGEGTPTTPSVTILDALLAWENERLRLALNASNLTDKEYFSNCWSWGTCSYGPARSVLLGATYRF